VKNREALSALADALCSSIGSLTNPNRVSNILQSVQKVKIDPDTVAKYIGYLEEAFLFEGAKRFNIKGPFEACFFACLFRRIICTGLDFFIPLQLI